MPKTLHTLIDFPVFITLEYMIEYYKIQCAKGIDVIDLFQCRCGGNYQEKRGWESCVCPRIWALPGIGRVLISKGSVSMKFRRRPIGVPVVRMFWWHNPLECPLFNRNQENVDDGLYPLLAPRVYDIWRKRRRVWNPKEDF